MKPMEYIACLLRSMLGFGFGDEANSRGGSWATTTSWVLVDQSLNEACVLWLRVTGANEVEISHDGQGTGFPLPVDVPVIMDRFKGRLYARSNAGASTLYWYISARNVSD